MRLRHQETSRLQGGKSFIQQISLWLSRAICRPGVQRANSGRMFKIDPQQVSGIPNLKVYIDQFTSNLQTNQHNQHNQSVSKRSRNEDEDCEVQNMTIDEMLNKYANENSEDDSDFVPNAEDESESSESSDSSHSKSSDESNSNEEQEPEQEQENVEKVSDEYQTLVYICD